MKKIDHITIKIDKKPFGKYKVVSERAYKDDLCTLVMFDNQEFIWIPTWKEVGEIIKALLIAENMNLINRGETEIDMKQHLKKMSIE